MAVFKPVIMKDKTVNVVYVTEIVAESVQFLEPKGSSAWRKK